MEFAAEAETDEELELLLEEPHPAARSANVRESISVVTQRRLIRIIGGLASGALGGSDVGPPSVGRRN